MRFSRQVAVSPANEPALLPLGQGPSAPGPILAINNNNDNSY